MRNPRLRVTSRPEIASALLLVVGLVSACAATPAGFSTPRRSDAIEVEASPATTSEIGVAVWSVARSVGGGVVGYDADNAVVVELTRTTKVEGERTLDAYVITQDGASSRVVLAAEPDGATTVLDAAVSQRHRRTAELVTQDLEVRPSVREPPSLSTASFAGGLRPLDDNPPRLADQECVDLLTTCDPALVNYNAAHSQLVAQCVTDDYVRAFCDSACPQHSTEPYHPRFCAMTNTGPGCFDHYKASFQSGCDAASKVQGKWAQTAQQCENNPKYRSSCGGKYRIDKS